MARDLYSTLRKHLVVVRLQDKIARWCFFTYSKLGRLALGLRDSRIYQTYSSGPGQSTNDQLYLTALLFRKG